MTKIKTNTGASCSLLQHPTDEWRVLARVASPMSRITVTSFWKMSRITNITALVTPASNQQEISAGQQPWEVLTSWELSCQLKTSAHKITRILIGVTVARGPHGHMRLGCVTIFLISIILKQFALWQGLLAKLLHFGHRTLVILCIINWTDKL